MLSRAVLFNRAKSLMRLWESCVFIPRIANQKGGMMRSESDVWSQICLFFSRSSKEWIGLGARVSAVIVCLLVGLTISANAQVTINSPSNGATVSGTVTVKSSNQECMVVETLDRWPRRFYGCGWTCELQMGFDFGIQRFPCTHRIFISIGPSAERL